jgi:hypothetical protein
VLIDKEVIYRNLLGVADPALSGILEARERSDLIIADAGRLIESNLIEILGNNGDLAFASSFGWIAVGSVGRAEATAGSDLDLIMVVDVEGELTEEQQGSAISVDQAVREILRRELQNVVGISRGHELTKPVTIRALRNSASVGGRSDSVIDLTRRILLLTESRALYQTRGEDLATAARKAVLDVFQASSITRGKHLLSLVNDVVRYYRTLCVDYKSRIDVEEKPWGIRNIKLGHSRKTWFMATMMGIIACTSDREYEPEIQEAMVTDLLSLSPVERLTFALVQAGMVCHLSVLRVYSRYLSLIGEEGFREALTHVEHHDRYDSNEFRILKDNSDMLNQRYLDIIEDLPPHWQRHLFSHFLL